MDSQVPFQALKCRFVALDGDNLFTAGGIDMPRVSHTGKQVQTAFKATVLSQLQTPVSLLQSGLIQSETGLIVDALEPLKTIDQQRIGLFDSEQKLKE